jgi:hypothetical protein
VELRWLDDLPEQGEEPRWRHDAVAAIARAHPGKYILVDGMPSYYASEIADGRLVAYRPTGDYVSFSRGGVVLVSYVGKDPLVDFTTRTFPPMKVAVLEEWEIPRTNNYPVENLRESADLADAMRANPGRWVELPQYLVAGAVGSVSMASTRAFAPAGAFESKVRGHRLYGRFVGDPEPAAAYAG